MFTGASYSTMTDVTRIFRLPHKESERGRYAVYVADPQQGSSLAEAAPFVEFFSMLTVRGVDRRLTGRIVFETESAPFVGLVSLNILNQQ